MYLLIIDVPFIIFHAIVLLLMVALYYSFLMSIGCFDGSSHLTVMNTNENQRITISVLKCVYQIYSYIILPCSCMLFQGDGLRDSDKIAAFDFDGCLVRTSVKR